LLELVESNKWAHLYFDITWVIFVDISCKLTFFNIIIIFYCYYDRFFNSLSYYTNLFFQNLLILVWFINMNHEDIEMYIHFFYYFWTNNSMSICCWYKHWFFEVVIKLNFNWAMICSSFRMFLKPFLENKICHWSTPLRRLVFVCWELEVKNTLKFFECKK